MRNWKLRTETTLTGYGYSCTSTYLYVLVQIIMFMELFSVENEWDELAFNYVMCYLEILIRCIKKHAQFGLMHSVHNLKSNYKIILIILKGRFMQKAPSSYAFIIQFPNSRFILALWLRWFQINPLVLKYIVHLSTYKTRVEWNIMEPWCSLIPGIESVKFYKQLLRIVVFDRYLFVPTHVSSTNFSHVDLSCFRCTFQYIPANV